MTIAMRGGGERRRQAIVAGSLATVLLLRCAVAAGDRPDQPDPASRAALLERYGDAMRAGDHAGAATAAREALALSPDDPLLAHNLACAEAKRGNLAAAWSALEQSLGGELADPRLAASDPDLADLRADPRFGTLLEAVHERLRERADARGLTLREGYESEELTLEHVGREIPRRGGHEWPLVKVRVTYGGGGLGFKATVAARSFRDHAQPWRFGDGFRVTVAAPPPGGGFDSDRSFGFGFGVAAGNPTGALIEKDGEPQLQALVDLSPKVRIHGRRAEYSFRVPWTAIAPYAPPVDSLLGLNVSYVRVDDAGVRHIVELVPEPALRTGQSPWRRHLPIRLVPSDRSEEVLRGAVSSTIVGDGSLGIRLAAYLAEGGRAPLRVDVKDATGQTVGSSSEVAEGGDALSPVTRGVNRWLRAADLSALPTGPFHLAAELITPAGKTLRWQTGLLRVEPGWLEQARRRAAEVTADDRPSLEYRLARIADALATHDPRADPGALGTTLVETGMLLRRAEASGHVLPDSGLFVAAYRTSAGEFAGCGLVLPQGHHELRSPRLLVLLAGGGIGAGRHAAQIIEQARLPVDVIAVIPDWPPPGEALAGSPAARISEAARWAGKRFGARETLLAGLDEGASDALQVSLDQPSVWSRVLLLANSGWAPWSDDDSGRLANRLSRQRNDLLYSVVVAVPSANQKSEQVLPGPRAIGEAVPAAMAAAGFRIDSRQHAGTVISGVAAADWIRSWLAEKGTLKPRRN